jgi:rfaE bifunctional protein kinase chain/domain
MASELKDIRVHVVGDVIVDRVMHTKIIGGQVKTPTISVKSVGEDQFAGGAAVVAKTLAGSGSSVVLSSVLGKDERADFVATELLNSSVFLNGIIEDGRPTTLKLAVTAEGHRLLKIDTLDNSPVIGRSLQALVEAIKTVPADVVVFSDFRHGVFSHASLGVLREAIPENCFTAADSQVASRWGNILDFQGFHLITPNEREARFALGDQDSTVGSLARKLKAESACDTLMMKLGERGLICLYNESTSVAGANFALDSMAKAVLDPVGAGDAFLAYCTLVLYKYGSPHAAAIIGSAAAAASCETDGNEAVTLERVCDVLRRAFLMNEYSIA